MVELVHSWTQNFEELQISNLRRENDTILVFRVYLNPDVTGHLYQNISEYNVSVLRQIGNFK